jgi:multisubunit Na+/H+ antiporter MnhB subunit
MERLKDKTVAFLRKEDGLETIEVVIILVVLVTLAFALRRTLFNWYNTYIVEQTHPETGTLPSSPTSAH